MAGVKGRSGGRNAKTVEEHKRTGTFDPTRHAGYQNPAAPPGVPVPPKPLDGDALAEWERMITRLTQTGALSIVDDAVLFQYCRLFAETEGIYLAQEETAETIRILQENLDKRGKDIEFEQLLQVSQEITKLRKLEAGYIAKVRQGRMALRILLVEFGLTPAARGRVKLPEKPQDVDAFEALQNEKTALVRVK